MQHRHMCLLGNCSLNSAISDMRDHHLQPRHISAHFPSLYSMALFSLPMIGCRSCIRSPFVALQLSWILSAQSYILPRHRESLELVKWIGVELHCAQVRAGGWYRISMMDLFAATDSLSNALPHFDGSFLIPNTAPHEQALLLWPTSYEPGCIMQ